MARTVAARVEKIEPKALAAWRRAWQSYAVKVERATPDDVLEQALKAPDDEATWEAFQAEHGLEEIVAWWDQNDAIPVDPDEPDLARWPVSIPAPPPEPSGVWDRMQALRRAGGDAAAYASIAVFALGLARCVREVHA